MPDKTKVKQTLPVAIVSIDTDAVASAFDLLRKYEPGEAYPILRQITEYAEKVEELRQQFENAIILKMREKDAKLLVTRDGKEVRLVEKQRWEYDTENLESWLHKTVGAERANEVVKVKTSVDARAFKKLLDMGGDVAKGAESFRTSKGVTLTLEEKK